MAANPNKGATVEGAAQRISSLFSELAKPTEPQSTDEGQAKTTKAEVETPKGDTEANPKRVKAKLGDQEVELEILSDIDPELVPKGLMMEADYRKKTSEVSERRKALEAKESEMQEQLKDLEMLINGESEELESDQMKELREHDPAEYLRKSEALQDKAKKLKSYKDKSQQELNKRQQEIIKAEQSKYAEVIPEWHDEKVRNKDLTVMSKYLKKEGFSDDELASIFDRRLMKVCRDAAYKDEISNAQVENKRVTRPPKTQRAGSGDKEPESTAKNTARQRLKKSGKIGDAQAALKAFLEN